ASLGDIGRHFPDTDKEFAGADSRVLLRECAARIARAGFSIANVDSTVIAQAPKLAPHIDAMRVNIAADLKLPLERVNVKAKTNEKLGYLGRGEGIEAQAAVLLTRV
ncbi:MAG TPA: 2-C-methyl-D-erythritol 2,4-cyclodiphosphate synthase, partial [Paraburkholderia sp.]